MRRLMLLRHAKTEMTAPSGRDFDRRLDARGETDAGLIGRWMAADAPRADVALVSPAARARQTWDIVREALGEAAPTPRLTPELYAAEVSDLLAAIRAAGAEGNPASLLLVAHNPGLHELALCLIGSGDDDDARRGLAENLPTGALVVLDFAGASWDDVGLRSGALKLFVSPKMLKSQDGA